MFNCDTLLRSHSSVCRERNGRNILQRAFRVHQRVAKHYHVLHRQQPLGSVRYLWLHRTITSLRICSSQGLQVEAVWSERPQCGEASLVLLPEKADGCGVALQAVDSDTAFPGLMFFTPLSLIRLRDQMLQNERASSAAPFCSCKPWSNEWDEKRTHGASVSPRSPGRRLALALALQVLQRERPPRWS